MDKYYEILVQNVQKGELYTIKLKDDPQIYVSIPMIPGRFQDSYPIKFLMNVVAPEEKKGVHEYSLEDIEYLKRNDL
ncbi:MAG TPA: hypothetical protein VFD91_17460 [Mariniphaga sp.]|nr:hypothetical protein [Mariniphaga sp.]